MPSNLNKNTAKEGHNRSPEYIDDYIKKTDTIVTPLENQIKGLQKQVTDAKNDLKKNAGINFGVFDAFRKIAKMQSTDEQNELLTAGRRVLMALSPGGIVNWLDIAEEVDKDKKTSDEEAFKAQEGEDPNQITVEQAEEVYGDDDQPEITDEVEGENVETPFEEGLNEDNTPSTYADDEEPDAVGDDDVVA